MTDTKFKYWAFLSFSHQDNRDQRPDSPEQVHRCWGNWLDDALKVFPIPPEFVSQINGRGEIIPERIAPVFRDESELSENAELSAEIRDALEQSICLIVVCSPRSAQSRQVNEIVRYFKQLGRSKQHILPIVVAGEPNASDGNKPGRLLEEECFAPALRHPVLPDGTLDTTRRAGKSIFVDARHGAEKREILAVDHRPAEADLEMAKIQLIALLLGVGFNGLWWREQKRHFFDLTEAQQQAREALVQVEEARLQLLAAQQQVLEKQNLPRDVQDQIQAAQNQAREAQRQAQDAQKQLQESQKIFRDTQAQLETARQRVLATEGKVLEAQNQAREIQSQLEASHHQARAAENKFLEVQNLPPVVSSQTQEIQNLQRQLEATRQQAQAAEEKFLAAQRQIQVAENLVRAAQDDVQNIPNQGRNGCRLTKVFALLAVLGLLVAGQAVWQRRVAGQALITATAEAAGKFKRASGGVESVRLVLQKIGGAEQAEYRQRSLDALATGIPLAEIPEALAASAVMVNDSQRSHFQKSLLVRLGAVNPILAMTNAIAIAGNIVNDDGLSDSVNYFQLAVLDNWMKADLPDAFKWVCRLPDTDIRQRALAKTIGWVQSQPDSEVSHQALEVCIDELAKTDVPGALALVESLPEGAWRDLMTAQLWLQTNPLAIWEWINHLDLPSEIMQRQKAHCPWAKSLLKTFFGNLNILSAEAIILSTATNAPIQIEPKNSGSLP